MIEPTKNDIGRAVVYTGNRHIGGELERGVITSFNKWTVFVRYDGKLHSQGTDRRDLEWEHLRSLRSWVRDMRREAERP